MLLGNVKRSSSRLSAKSEGGGRAQKCGGMPRSKKTHRSTWNPGVSN